jgi:WD40 repeat protein
LPHSDRVTALAYGPDGRLALTACANGEVRLWEVAPDPAFDVLLPELVADKNPDRQLTLHDGRCTAVSSAKRVYSHDGMRSNHLCTLPLTGQLDRVAVARGGRVLATASRDERNSWGRPAKVRFWDANTGKQVGPTLVHPNTVWELAFSPDGQTLATACFDGNVRFWKSGTDLPAGPTLGHLKLGELRFAFSPDGRLFVTAGYGDATARVWDRANGELLHSFPHPHGIAAVALAPGNLRLLVGGGGTARLWDLTTQKPVGRPMTHPIGVDAVAFSPDGQIALTADLRSVQFWVAATALPLGLPLPCQTGVRRALAFAPDGNAVLVGHATGYRRFPIQRPVPDDARRLALSAQVLTGVELDEGGAVQVLDAATWNDRRRQLAQAGGSLLP